MTACLTTFRALQYALDGTLPAAGKVGASWYVERPEGPAGRIARAIELAPETIGLLTGAIGSGKTTELMAVGRTSMHKPGIFIR